MKRKVLSIICVMTVATTSILGNVVTASATNHYHSYTRMIRQMNAELKEKGYLTVAGRVSRAYYLERIYGASEKEMM